MSLPPEARDCVMRAWLEILRENVPGVTWVARAPNAPPQPRRRWAIS